MDVTLAPLQLIGLALRLSPVPFAPGVLPELQVALAVVFVAGLSSAVGQSVVLFANRVQPRRFLASLLLSAALFVVGFLFWSLSSWLVAERVFGVEAPYALIVRAVGLGYSPYLLGFFVLTPYLGRMIWVGLSIWALLASLVAWHTALGLTLWQALACSVLGWLVLQLLGRTIARPAVKLGGWLRRVVAGRALERNLAVALNHEEER